ncbi:MAG: hypothetical protein OXC03_07330 [Flavobacteriaceae bacterium]|nr:hypothetical protein [Flavobacteriaceae bacterium]
MLKRICIYFLKDVDSFLKTDVDYNQDDAFEWAKKEFIPSLIKECIRQWDPDTGTGTGGRDSM